MLRLLRSFLPVPVLVLVLVLVLVAVAAPLVATAAAIEVAPVSHDLAPGQTILSMTISNRADTETTLQVRGFAWTQDNGRDHLLPADDLLVAPAIFSVAPGRSQVLRVRVPRVAAGREASYRLLIDELPALADSGQVRMALRLSVPVFAHGVAPVAARLGARLDIVRRTVTLVNQGGSRARVHALDLVTTGGERIAAKSVDGPYLLSGAQREWSFAAGERAASAGGGVSVVALTDAGRVEVPLVASP